MPKFIHQPHFDGFGLIFNLRVNISQRQLPLARFVLNLLQATICSSAIGILRERRCVSTGISLRER